MSKISAKWKTEESAEIVLRVRETQVRQLYQQTWGGLSGIMFIMVAVCLALWAVVPHWKLLLWSGSLVLLSSCRALLTAVFLRKVPGGPHIDRWANLHVAGVVASGLMWALPSIFLWPGNSPVHQLIWPICIVALASSAVAKYCIWTPAYMPYLLLTMVPISLRLLAEGGLVYTILGLLGFVFTAILAQTGRMMHDASLGVLVMGIHNEVLSSVLSAEKAKEEFLNAQLQLEVKERARSQEELQVRNQELERLNAQLESALSNIKQLRGMLPICSSCKKIRNDKGYWEQIEAYIRDHSEAEFSHGICPDCAKRLYPQFYTKK